MLKRLAKKTLATFGYEIVKQAEQIASASQAMQSGDFPFQLWKKLRKEDQRKLSQYLPELHSQYGQDFFVLCCELLNPKIPKYFIEAGAADGVQWSNTFILEEQRGWTGLLVEPCKSFSTELQINRKVQLENRCLSASSNSKVVFREVKGANAFFPVSSPELSCIDLIQPHDWASVIREQNSFTYEVNTVSLSQALTDHCLPRHIGYLSLDTEGSELDILASIDFELITIDIITVEHNYRQNDMVKTKELLAGRGYELILQEISQGDFWFVRKPLAPSLYFARSS